MEQGLIFQDQDFRLLAMQAYLEKNSELDDIKEFTLSDHFIQNFKSRNRFSSRKPHIKRRPCSDSSYIEHWKFEISKLFDEVSHSRILNADETAWKIMPNGLTTWTVKGTDNIQLLVNDDAKECLTVMATITAAGTKLPLFIIAKGKTQQVEQLQIGDVYPHFTSHSESGLMTRTHLKNI